MWEPLRAEPTSDNAGAILASSKLIARGERPCGGLSGPRKRDLARGVDVSLDLSTNSSRLTPAGQLHRWRTAKREARRRVRRVSCDAVCARAGCCAWVVGRPDGAEMGSWGAAVTPKVSQWLCNIVSGQKWGHGEQPLLQQFPSGYATYGLH